MRAISSSSVIVGRKRKEASPISGYTGSWRRLQSVDSTYFDLEAWEGPLEYDRESRNSTILETYVVDFDLVVFDGLREVTAHVTDREDRAPLVTAE